MIREPVTGIIAVLIRVPDGTLLMTQAGNTQATEQTFQRVAILYHPMIEASHPLAEQIAGWLSGRGIETQTALTWDEERVRPMIPGLDLLIVIGGDGSILRAARMAAAYGIPIMGVNMGRLGFLSEVTPNDWAEQFPRVWAGEYWVEKRMMLRARAYRHDLQIGEYLALNDIVISRGALARLVRLSAEIDGDYLTTYAADGLIISTPTGSTAYALAAGGPILPPELRNILLQPIAPHLTLNRAIVLSEGAHIRVHVNTDHQAILTVDGQFTVEMEHEDTIDIEASNDVSRFIRLGKPTYFYHTLLDRLEPRQAVHNDV